MEETRELIAICEKLEIRDSFVSKRSKPQWKNLLIWNKGKEPIICRDSFPDFQQTIQNHESFLICLFFIASNGYPEDGGRWRASVLGGGEGVGGEIFKPEQLTQQSQKN